MYDTFTIEVWMDSGFQSWDKNVNMSRVDTTIVLKTKIWVKLLVSEQQRCHQNPQLFETYKQKIQYILLNVFSVKDSSSMSNVSNLMRCEDHRLRSSISLSMSRAKRWIFLAFFHHQIFLCSYRGKVRSTVLWQNSKAEERTDVLGWLMCLSSSPLKSSASVPLAPSSPELLCRVPPGVRATLQLMRLAAHLTLNRGILGQWAAKCRSGDTIMCHLKIQRRGQDSSLEKGLWEMKWFCEDNEQLNIAVLFSHSRLCFDKVLTPLR